MMRDISDSNRQNWTSQIDYRVTEANFPRLLLLAYQRLGKLDLVTQYIKLISGQIVY